MSQLNYPDEVFDNSSEEENHPELGSQSQTGAATDIDQEYTDTTDDGDGELLLKVEPNLDPDSAVDPATIDTTDDGDGEVFNDDEE
jgi:hypothetical protein